MENGLRMFARRSRTYIYIYTRVRKRKSNDSKVSRRDNVASGIVRTGIRFDGAVRSCYARQYRSLEGAISRSFRPSHYEALTASADYYPRDNGYNTFFFRSRARFPGEASFQFPFVATDFIALALALAIARSRNFLAFAQRVSNTSVATRTMYLRKKFVILLGEP